LIPDDPSVLLTTAGMQQFKKYYTGELDAKKDFGSKNTVSIQKAFRTSDIDEVGDETHLTFFEMLGNFSFGGYWKKEAIRYGYDFITKEMKLPIDYVTVFDPAKVDAGDWRKNVPFDQESYDVWKNEIKIPEEKIRREGVDNFWGPTGSEGPCGPTTEIYVKNANGKSVEIWNIVFNEFYCSADKKLKKAKIPGVDTGMGLERLAMVSQGVKNIFETDLFAGLINLLPAGIPDRTKRIFADHVRAIVFLISDGVRPSNKEAGYVLRKLLRRLIASEFSIGFRKEEKKFYVGGRSSGIDLKALLSHTVDYYSAFYPDLDQETILKVFEDESSIFTSTLNRGFSEMYGYSKIDGEISFKLFESFGLPFEIIKDLGGERVVDLHREDFDKKFIAHQEKSRAGAEKKFGGHGLVLNTGELKAGSEEELKKVLRLHTATHLLQQALREVLGAEVHQMGSDITPERTRFDFSFSRKMTPEEIKKTEELVNRKIKEDLPVSFKEMSKDEAEKVGALHFFKEKYPDKVKVYYVGKDLKTAWSKEFCGGPHVTHTGEIGRFKIAKEEAVGAGVRRVRGVVD
jgi:alanyl-tRNA synthetase